jgi:hypothetical protein
MSNPVAEGVELIMEAIEDGPAVGDGEGAAGANRGTGGIRRASVEGVIALCMHTARIIMSIL